MRIGIDARSLARRLTGIGIYVFEMVRLFTEYDEEDEFYLYSNKKISHRIDGKNNLLYRDDESKMISRLPGSVYIETIVPKRLMRDGIEVFWGPEHFLPKPTGNIKYVLTVHDLVAIKFPALSSFYNGIVQRTVLAKSCKRAETIVAISESTKNDLEECFDIDRNKIEVIYDGDSPYRGLPDMLPDDLKKSCEEKFASPLNYILYVGTIEPRKNITTIVEAFNIFRETSKNETKLIIAGGRGWKSRKIYELIDSSPVRDDIVLTGYVSDGEKEWLYRNALLLAFPSLYEGFGFPIVEAMSVGVPVITSRVSSMPEVGGDAAFYLDDPKDKDSLAKLYQMISGWTNPEREKASKCCIIQADKFTREACAKSLLNIFNQEGI